MNMYRRACPTCEISSGRPEAPRSIPLDSAAYKRRLDSVTVVYLCSNRAATGADNLTYRENPSREHPAISQDCVNFCTEWKTIRLLLCGRGQWFESTIAPHAARIPPARCVELPSYSRVFPPPPLPRKVHRWPP